MRRAACGVRPARKEWPWLARHEICDPRAERLDIALSRSGFRRTRTRTRTRTPHLSCSRHDLVFPTSLWVARRISALVGGCFLGRLARRVGGRNVEIPRWLRPSTRSSCARPRAGRVSLR
jgi:hypothetical protein